MHALHDLVKAGLVRYIGMCSCYAWQCLSSFNSQTELLIHSQSTSCRVRRLLASLPHTDAHPDYAISNNLTPFISMQNQYSLIYREEEREMIPTLKVRPTLS